MINSKILIKPCPTIQVCGFSRNFKQTKYKTRKIRVQNKSRKKTQKKRSNSCKKNIVKNIVTKRKKRKKNRNIGGN